MLLILVSSLIGCNNKDTKNGNIDYEVFVADVISSEEGLLITPAKDSVEYSSSDKIYVAIGEAEIIDEKGKAADIDILKPGDRIKVYYNGIIII